MLRHSRLAGRAWKHHLNYPLFVPENGWAVLSILDTAGSTAFVEEVKRLASLGSPWASAVLGYLHLRSAVDGTRNLKAAMDACCSPAAAGHAYAQYVLAWALLLDGQPSAAVDSLQRSGVQLFSPAMLDLARFVWHGWGVEPDPRIAVEMLSHASALKHFSALLFKCAFLRTGKLGVVRQLIGYSLTPLALVRYMIALRFDPFGPSTFFFDPNARRPLFRIPVVDGCQDPTQLTRG